MDAAFRDRARETGPALEAHYRFILWLVPALEKEILHRRSCKGKNNRATLAQAAMNEVLDTATEFG